MTLDLLEVATQWRVGWRYATTTSGVQCVMILGVHSTLEWSVVNWDTHQQVCKPSFHESKNSYSHTNLIYTTIGATAYVSARFGAGAGPIVMDDVRCTATESRLIDCPATFNHNCVHSEDAGVRCISSSTGMLCYFNNDATKLFIAASCRFTFNLISVICGPDILDNYGSVLI